MRNKKAAMEMSVGTIVTIVLLMSVLVLGLLLTKNIFSSAQGAIKMTDSQLTKQINEIYGEETELGIYPESKTLEIKLEKEGEVGIIIRNLLEETSGAATFQYEVLSGEIPASCPLSESQVLNLIKLGKSGSTKLMVGDSKLFRVRFDIPSGTPLCAIRYAVEVTSPELRGPGNENGFYDSVDFDLEITA